MDIAPELDELGFCPFALITGKPCVLCGGSRAVLALLRGDMNRAVQMNASVVLFSGFFIAHLLVFTAIGRFRTLSYLGHPNESVRRASRFLATHWLGTLLFGLAWWFWNIQRWN